MKNIFFGAVLLCMGAAVVCGAAQSPSATVVPAAQAADHAGRTVTVEGTPSYVFNNGKSVMLALGEPTQTAFKVQILKEHWPAFGRSFGKKMGRNLEKRFPEGSLLRVTGEVAWYQGAPAVYVADPSRIEVLTKP